MGILDRVERGLERAVKAPFAKVFKAEVQPVEIASEVRAAMDDRAAVLGPGRTMVPNVFTVELAPSDFERLDSFHETLTTELEAAAEDHAVAQRYTPSGAVQVRLARNDELETGIFQVRPTSSDGSRGRRAAAGAPDRRRPAPADRRAPRPGAAPEPRPGAAPRPSAAPPRPDQGRAPRPEGPRPGRPPAYDPEGYAAPRHDTRQLPAAVPPEPARPPRPTHRPWLDVDGRRHELTAAVTVLGRDHDGADVVLDDPGVSRRHAEVRITHDGPRLELLVRDLDSTNGTYLNGEEVGTEQLSDGDRLTLGRTTVTVHLERGR